MLKGFSVPLTPQGQSALATRLPWHYSSDYLVIESGPHSKVIHPLFPKGLFENAAFSAR